MRDRRRDRPRRPDPAGGLALPADVYLTENSPELMLLTSAACSRSCRASITQPGPGRSTSRRPGTGSVSRCASAPGLQPLAAPARAAPGQSSSTSPSRSGRARSRSRRPTPTSCPSSARVIATLRQAGRAELARGLKANAATYADDEAVVAAVNRGQVACGMINQYYWYRLRLELGAGTRPQRSCTTSRQEHRRAREHLRRRGARLLVAQGRRREIPVVPRLRQAEKILAAGDTYEYPYGPGPRPTPR